MTILSDSKERNNLTKLFLRFPFSNCWLVFVFFFILFYDPDCNVCRFGVTHEGPLDMVTTVDTGINDVRMSVLFFSSIYSCCCLAPRYRK